jgi:hypothetical protein
LPPQPGRLSSSRSRPWLAPTFGGTSVREVLLFVQSVPQYMASPHFQVNIAPVRSRNCGERMTSKFSQATQSTEKSHALHASPADPGMNYTLNRPLLDGTSPARLKEVGSIAPEIKDYDS